MTSSVTRLVLLVNAWACDVLRGWVGDWSIVELNRRVNVNIPLPTHALAADNVLATQFWR
jgi:hypothetical protein